MKIAIASGGTGGHIYPGIALAEEIRNNNPADQVLFLGSEDGLEKELVPRAGFRIELVRARALLRKISYKAISAPFISLIGFFQALGWLRKFSPDVFIATGGYVSLPTVLAAKFLGVPIFILEQNVLPGFTNRLYARWAKQLFLSFEESKQYLDGAVTGNPVRRSIIEADRAEARRRLGFGPDDKVVIVVGGSQGARGLNRAVMAALPLIEAQSTIKIVHVLGSRDHALAAGIAYPFYRPVEYAYDMAGLLAAADLVVSRAGATAIAEFAVRGLPMFLVPFPFSAEGHQDINAETVERRGAGVKIDSRDFTPEKFLEILTGAQYDLKAMGRAAGRLAQPAAAKKITEIIYGTRT